MNFRTVSDMNRCIVNNLELVSDEVDLVVSILCSGMLPAAIVALHRNLPMADWAGFLNVVIIHIGLEGEPFFKGRESQVCHGLGLNFIFPAQIGCVHIIAIPFLKRFRNKDLTAR